ncbi:MAG: hypothetical protein RRC07_09630 [Anaerolineae bacterium]|nr:hypothetical protein [Anaerolineae bacterium]
MTIVLYILIGWMLISALVLFAACSVSARFTQEQENEPSARYAQGFHAYGD